MCPCCGHRDTEHMDEAGDPLPCWECIKEREGIRERAWRAGPVRRWLHRVMAYHMWHANRCARCGVRHP